MTMKIIQHQELASGQASITFNSIPQIYTDLVLVCSLRGNRYAGLSLNGSTANTSSRTLWGTGSTVMSANYTSLPFSNIILTVAKDTSTASTFGNASIYIANYTGSTAKSVSIDSVGENNGAAAEQIMGAGLWNNTSAITSLTLTSLDDNGAASGTFAQYSSATLYGILKGTDGTTTVS